MPLADATGAESLSDGTRSVIITYLIAHGMAESSVASGRLARGALVTLIRSDHAALVAIRAQAHEPSWDGLMQADDAVQDLLETATLLDSAGPPVRRSASLSR